MALFENLAWQMKGRKNYRKVLIISIPKCNAISEKNSILLMTYGDILMMVWGIFFFLVKLFSGLKSWQ